MKVLSINYSIIKNGLNKKFSSVFVHNSSLTLSFLDVLFREGLICHYTILSNGKIEVFLKYFKGVPILKNIKPMSTSGRSIHYSVKDICRWKGMYSSYSAFLVVNSSKKVFSSNELKSYKVGGEVLCIIS